MDSFERYLWQMNGGGRHPRPETPHLDELNRVVGAERLATWNPRTRGRLAWGQTREYGGEWDWVPLITKRNLRRLQGAGWMRASGELPDCFAEIIRTRGPAEAQDDPIDWYLRYALAAIDERRRLARYERETRFLTRVGCSTYYEYRDRRAREAGWDGYGALRRFLEDHPLETGPWIAA